MSADEETQTVMEELDTLWERLERMQQQLAELKELAQKRNAQQAGVIVDEGRRQGTHPELVNGYRRMERR